MEKGSSNFWKEFFKLVFISLIIVVPFRLYIAQPFIVDGASMDPTFHTNNYLIVDEATYYFNREMIMTGGDSRMFEWQKHFYAFLSRNARQARDYYQLPPMQIIDNRAKIGAALRERAKSVSVQPVGGVLGGGAFLATLGLLGWRRARHGGRK